MKISNLKPTVNRMTVLRILTGSLLAIGLAAFSVTDTATDLMGLSDHGQFYGIMLFIVIAFGIFVSLITPAAYDAITRGLRGFITTLIYQFILLAVLTLSLILSLEVSANNREDTCTDNRLYVTYTNPCY